MGIQQRYVIDFYDLRNAYKKKYDDDLDIDDVTNFEAIGGGHCFFYEFDIEEERYQYLESDDEEREWYQKAYNVANLLLEMNPMMDSNEHVIILFDW